MRQIGPLAVESDRLFRVLICPGVRGLFYLCQREGEMGLDLAVVLLIGGELAVFVHEIVCDHIELQLLVLRIEDQIILLVRRS